MQSPVVLVVDDDADLRAAIADLLGSVGLAALLFGSTDQLLAAPLPDRPACLVLDLRLPGASGLDLQRHLANAGIPVPIIFITGYADVPTTVRAMKAGAVDFLTKPFRDQELLDAVTTALRTDAARREKDSHARELRLLADQLTPRETEVLAGVGRGLLNKQIAYELGVSEITVKMHRSSAGRKIKAVSVADMVRKIELLKL